MIQNIKILESCGGQRSSATQSLFTDDLRNCDTIDRPLVHVDNDTFSFIIK